jgi:hypothetical protein
MEDTAITGSGVKDRAAAWVAWSMAVLTVLLTILHVMFWTLSESVPGALDSRGEAGPPIAFAVVGALILTRRAGNRIGWLFCWIGLAGSLTGAFDAYALYGLAARPDAGLPGATAAAWVASWSWAPGFFLPLVLLPLLYPTGQLPSPRWHPVAWLAVVSILLAMIANAFRPGPLTPSEVPVATNPLGITGATGLLEVVDSIGAVLFVPLFFAAVASVLVRFRRARGVERQQLKWFLYATVAILVGFWLVPVTPAVIFDPSELLADLLIGVLSLGWPVALGIAVLRYRLYDIDRLVNRTLVYGLLTIVLGGVYASTVLVFGELFGGIGAEPPSWAVAGATLAAAALFQPLRRRIQEAVDRRFNRRRYDAGRTVEAFSGRLRDQVDLDTLTAELLAVVSQTVEPAAVSLWLRPRATPSGQPALARHLEPG